MRVAQSIFLAVAFLAAGAGCQSTYKQSMDAPRPEVGSLRQTTRVYIAMPEDAIDKKAPVPSSGRRTVIALEDAFKRQTRGVIIGHRAETLPEAIAHAKERDCEVVAFATLIKWEDRLTEWSGVRDKLEMRIDIVSVATGDVIRTTTIEAKSKIMTDGDDAPQDLLPDPVDKFVRSLFRVSYTPSALQ